MGRAHYAAPMSMLTPPEMGGPYRIKGNKYPRMRPPRRRRRPLVLLGAVLALALVGLGTMQLIDVFSGDGDGHGGTAAAAGQRDGCRQSAKPGDGRPSSGGRTAAELPEPGKVTVNVLNATTRTGLARDTADDLEKRGFRIGRVANAPAAYDKKVTGTGVLLGAPAAEDGAMKVLGTQLPRAATETDDRKGDAVDLILGDGFTRLTRTAEAKAALTALAEPSPSPSSSCG